MRRFGITVNSKKDGKFYSRYIHILSVDANNFKEAKEYVEKNYSGMTVYESYKDALKDCIV